MTECGDQGRREVFAARLREARYTQRMSQQAAADLIGVERWLLKEMEAARVWPNVGHLYAIAVTYGICVHELLFGAKFEPLNLQEFARVHCVDVDDSAMHVRPDADRIPSSQCQQVSRFGLGAIKKPD